MKNQADIFLLLEYHQQNIHQDNSGYISLLANMKNILVSIIIDKFLKLALHIMLNCTYQHKFWYLSQHNDQECQGIQRNIFFLQLNHHQQKQEDIYQGTFSLQRLYIPIMEMGKFLHTFELNFEHNNCLDNSYNCHKFQSSYQRKKSSDLSSICLHKFYMQIEFQHMHYNQDIQVHMYEYYCSQKVEDYSYCYRFQHIAYLKYLHKV